MRTILRLLALLAVSTLVSADSGVSLPTPTAAAANTYAHDLFFGLLGSFGDSPWKQVGGTTSLLGQLFLIFNTFVFSVGVCWSSFSLVGATVQTAHEGEVFGKRFSTVWLPVRMLAGMSSVVPVFGGYSAAQAIMMSAALMGNGVADSGYTAVINAVSSGSALVSPANGAMTTMGVPAGADTIVEQMFRSSACVHYINAMSVRGGGSAGYARSVNSTADRLDIAYGSTVMLGLYKRTQCGKVTVLRKASSAHTTTNSVNYNGIASQVYQSTSGTVQSFAGQIDAAAKQWVDAVTGNGSFEPDQMNTEAIPDLAPIKTQFVSQLASSRQQAFASGMPTITAEAQANMKQGGWMAAGAWYQTIAMETDAMREATSSSFGYTEPTNLNDTFAQELQQAIERTNDSTSPNSASSSGKSAEANAICQALKSVTSFTNGLTGVNNGNGWSATTATGNCSFGQAFASYLINFTATSGGGLWGMGSTASINPILASKSMGDYLLLLGDSIQGMGWAARTGGWLAEKVGTVAKVAGVGTGQAWLAGAGRGAEMLGEAAQRLAPLAMPMILLGLLMAVYIPLIPFITWFGALISYATIFVEAIAASPLFGMAHLDPNGDGMGSRTQYGYLFLLNVLLRPILMLIGFIAASALMIILGSILYAMFMPAMANVQGDSITGIYTILAFLAIFWIMNLMLVQGGMNLIFAIPDQVLNWLGSVGQSHLGKEAESKVYGMIFSVAAMGRNMVAGVASGREAQKQDNNKHSGKTR